MAHPDASIPVPAEPESPRAAWQALAQRLGVVQPGVSISEELVAFAEAVSRMALGDDK